MCDQSQEHVPQGLERDTSVVQNVLLLQKTPVQFLAPVSGHSQLHRKDPSSAGWTQDLWPEGTSTHRVFLKKNTFSKYVVLSSLKMSHTYGCLKLFICINIYATLMWNFLKMKENYAL